VADHYIGDSFILYGTANLAAGETVLIQIQSVKTHPGIMIEGDRKSGISSTTVVHVGNNSLTEWTFSVNMTDWIPGTYQIIVTPVNPKYNLSADAQFNLTERPNPAPDVPVAYTLNSSTVMQNISSETTIPSKRSAAVPVIISFLAIGGIAVFSHFKRSS
jgi:hypothetical protein